MKRKLLLITFMVAIIACLFVMSLSAAEPNYDGEKVTLDDGTVCPLYDVDGNPLAWYVKSVAEDGKKTYGYVSAAFFDTANPPSERIDFISTGGGSTELNNFYVTVDGVVYDKSTLVVLNMRNAKITGGGKNRDGNEASFPYNILSDSKNLEYLYLNLKTSSIGQAAFKSCPNLKYVNFDELTELKSIGQQSFIGCSRLYENRVLDFTNTKLESTATNSLRGCATTEFIFPATFKTAGQETFKDCKYVTKITFLGGLTSISTTYTFENCEKLETVIGTGTALASITSIGDYMFKNCKSIKNVEGMIVDGHLTIPCTVERICKESFRSSTIKSVDFGSNPIITEIKYDAFTGCTALTEIVLPNTLTTVGERVCSASGVKYAVIPDSVTSMGYGMFMDCKSLEFVELGTGTAVRNKMFSGCTALKAVSIPEGITKIDSNAFVGCTALKAVYLPSSLVTIGDNTGWGTGAFDSCTSLYFVNEAFAVKDENGNWLGADFVMPTEPEVYFMPDSLETVFGCEFKDCKQLNRYVVFPTGVTQINAWEGAFSNTGINNSKGAVTYVFLGDMDVFCYSARDNRYKNVSFVFANPNDVDVTSFTKMQLGYRAAAVNSYAYFCAGNVVYDLSSFTPPSESYIVQANDFKKTVNTEDTQIHFQNPKAPTSQAATCLEGATVFKTCFCGAKYDIHADEANPALGHIYNFSSITSIVYADYTANGVFCCACDREGCKGVVNETIEDSYLFTYLGYSKNAYGDMCVSYTINKEFLQYYKTLKGEDFKFGVLGTIIDFDENGVMIDGQDNPLAQGYEDTVIDADLTENDSILGCDFRIKGFGNPEYSDLYLALNMYVIDSSSVYYIWENDTCGTHATVNFEKYKNL